MRLWQRAGAGRGKCGRSTPLSSPSPLGAGARTTRTLRPTSIRPPSRRRCTSRRRRGRSAAASTVCYQEWGDGRLRLLSLSLCSFSSSAPADNSDIVDERTVIYPALQAAGLEILIYNGESDACVPITDNEWWTTSMNCEEVTAARLDARLCARSSPRSPRRHRREAVDVLGCHVRRASPRLLYSKSPHVCSLPSRLCRDGTLGGYVTEYAPPKGKVCGRSRRASLPSRQNTSSPSRCRISYPRLPCNVSSRFSLCAARGTWSQRCSHSTRGTSPTVGLRACPSRRAVARRGRAPCARKCPVGSCLLQADSAYVLFN